MHFAMGLQADLSEGQIVMEEGCNFTIQGLEHKVIRKPYLRHSIASTAVVIQIYKSCCGKTY